MSKEKKSIEDQVIDLLWEKGPKTARDMMPWIEGFPYKSIYQKCLDLQKKNFLDKDAAGVWSLKPGVTNDTPVTGELNPNIVPPWAATTHPANPAATPPATPTPTATTQPPAGAGAAAPQGAPLSSESQFSDLLVGVGVDKLYVPTITKLFFDGNINDLKWLREVLNRHAAGFVKKHQVSLIFATWSKSRGLPYDPDEFPIEESDGKSPGKGKAVEEGSTPFDPGIGWRVDKDVQGEWRALPGGPLKSYEEALRFAEKRAALSIAMGGMATAAEVSTEGAEGKPAPKGGGGRQVRSFQDIFMEKAVDILLEKGKPGDGRSEEYKALEKRLEDSNRLIKEMRDEQQENRLSRIEQGLATIASSNPWDDPVQLERMRQRLGVGSSTVTDQSPMVQLAKDSSEKLDKTLNRMVGLIERVTLKEGEYRPEATRSPGEKETKAGALLDEATRRERSKQLRDRAFST